VNVKATGDGWLIVKDTAFPLAYLEDGFSSRYSSSGAYNKNTFFSYYNNSCPDEEGFGHDTIIIN
jgi:hypothetical protein